MMSERAQQQCSDSRVGLEGLAILRWRRYLQRLDLRPPLRPARRNRAGHFFRSPAGTNRPAHIGSQVFSTPLHRVEDLAAVPNPRRPFTALAFGALSARCHATEFRHLGVRQIIRSRIGSDNFGRHRHLWGSASQTTAARGGDVLVMAVGDGDQKPTMRNFFVVRRLRDVWSE